MGEVNGEIAQTTTEEPVVLHEFAVLLSSTRKGARLARLFTVAQLALWGLPSEFAAHIVGELAANAAVHGRVPGRGFRLALTVTASTTLRIEVTDTRGDRLPRSGHGPAPFTAESGRGLLLVEAFADRWGVTEGPPPRKTVWAELGLFKKKPASDQR